MSRGHRPVWAALAVLAAALLLAPLPLDAQNNCLGSIVWIPSDLEDEQPRNCGIDARCYEPKILGASLSGTPAKARVSINFPGNSQNDPSEAGFAYSFASVIVRDSNNVAIGACGLAGAVIDTDYGVVEWGADCSETYTVEAIACPCFGPFCPLCEHREFKIVSGGASCLPQPPCCEECEPCPAGSAGGSVGGGGAAVCEGVGENAALRFSAGGAGSDGQPGAEAWRPVLGKGWSHEYAERIVAPVDDTEVWLVTRLGSLTRFFDLQGGVYQDVIPSDEYRKLHRLPTGWELRGLEGSVQSFGPDGLWTGTTDANGNAELPSYDLAGNLTRVDLPDGRTELFTYHPDGKLAAIEYVGVGGAASRTWSYTWSGDGLARADRPDGTALEFFYNDPDFPDYLTRVDLVGTDASRRVKNAWQYDSEGNVVRSWRGETTTGPGGESPGPGAVDLWSLVFDDPLDPAVTTVTDPLGNVSVYGVTRDTFDDKPKVTTISGDCPTCGLGPNSQLTYDDPDHPLRVTRAVDGRGTPTVMEYDENGRMTARIEAFGTPLERTTTWEYGDPAFPGLMTAMERPSTSGSGVRRTEIGLDGSGNALTRTITGVEGGSAFSYTTQTTYNPAGEPQTVDPPGFGASDQTSFTYDPARGNLLPLTRTDPLIGATTFGYDPFNRRSSVTDVNGVAAETTFDGLNRVRFSIRRGATPAEDLVTENRYNVFGDLELTILPEGNRIAYEYDPAGRLISIERQPASGAPAERTFYTLDSVGNRIREDLQLWNGTAWETKSFTQYEYSTRCQLDKTIHADGTVTENAYDCNGNLEAVWDANHPSNGQSATPSQSYAYDELDRLTSVTQPWAGAGGGTAVTTYDYDIQDHLTSVTDAEGNTTTYTYSDRDLLTRQDSPVSGTTTFTYNDHGELASETDARSITVVRTTDELDRVVFMDYPENALDTTYTYDDPGVPFSKGRLTSISRSAATVDYLYDRFGRITRDGALTYSYDRNSNRTGIGYPQGVSTSSTYDFADRQATLTLDDGTTSQAIVTGASYLPSGPLTSLQLGNGLTETRDFNSRYFPTGISVPGLLDWDYATDAVGNILSIVDALDASQSRTYGYLDHHYFLTRGDGPWGDLSWTYDKIGNRLTETRDGVTDSYRYRPSATGGHNPQLTEVAAGGDPSDVTRYFYDAAGNQTFRSEGDSKVRYGYDASGRLAQIREDAATTALVQFEYDGRSFLADSSRSAAPGQPSQIVTQPSYSSEGLLHHKATATAIGAPRERDAPSTDSDSFVLYLSARPVAIHTSTTETDAQGQSSTTARLEFLTADHLGTPVLATDMSGTATWSGGFEPFGQDYSGAEVAGQFLRFPGQWADGSWQATEPELSYNVHRWYEARTARYTRVDPDPFVDPISQLPYMYAAQRPTVFVDPLGLRLGDVDPATFDIPLKCAIQNSPPEFRRALTWLINLRAEWDIIRLEDSSSVQGGSRRRVLDPGQGSFVDRSRKQFVIDTRDPSCKNVVGDLVREITELYAHDKLGKSPDTPLGFGGASHFADPIVRQTTDKACEQCPCKDIGTEH